MIISYKNDNSYKDSFIFSVYDNGIININFNKYMGYDLQEASYLFLKKEYGNEAYNLKVELYSD